MNNDFSTLPSYLLCEVSEQDHILKEPRKLPCKHTVCLQCISDQAESNRKFICKFCHKSHNILKDVARDLLCEEALEENLHTLGLHELNRLDLASYKTSDLFTGSQNAIESLFEFYLYDIEIRFDSLRAEVDIKAAEVLKMFDKNVNQIFDNAELEFKEIELKKKKSLVESEAVIQKLTDISIDLNKIQNFSLINTEENESIINMSQIGKLNHPLSHNSIGPNFKYNKTINLETHPRGVCEYLDNQVLITDHQHNCLRVHKADTYRWIRTVLVIDNEPIIEPTAIMMDPNRAKCVILCINKKILIIDIFLEKILTEIMLPLDCPGDASSFFSNHIRDFCASNTRNDSVLIFYESNIFEVNYSTKNEKDSSKPKIDYFSPLLGSLSLEKNSRITAYKDLLAVGNNLEKKILIHNSKSNSIESVIELNETEAVHSMLFCDDDSKLFVHVNDACRDRLVCFSKCEQNTEWDRSFYLDLPNEIKGSWSLDYIHGKLVIVSWSQNLIIFS